MFWAWTIIAVDVFFLLMAHCLVTWSRHNRVKQTYAPRFLRWYTKDVRSGLNFGAASPQLELADVRKMFPERCGSGVMLDR